LAFLVAAEVGIRTVDHAMTPLPPAAPPPLAQLPLGIGTWSGKDVELDPLILGRSGAFDMVNRNYQSPLGEQVALNAGVWLDIQPYIQHRPESCYPAAGRDVEDRKVVEIRRDE